MMRLSSLVASKTFRKLMVYGGGVVVIATVFLALDPRPFVRLGYMGVFVYSLFGTGTLIVPLLSAQLNLYLLALAAAAGMAINDSLSWWVGRNGEEVVPWGKKSEKLAAGVKKYGTAALFFWALIPFPYDAVGLIAGYLGVPWWKFVAATFAGRVVRFVIIGQGWGWYTQRV